MSEFIKEIFIKEPQTYVKPFPGIFRWICISSIIYGTVYAFVHTNVEPFLAKAANFTGFFLSLIYLIFVTCSRQKNCSNDPFEIRSIEI